MPISFKQQLTTSSSRNELESIPHQTPQVPETKSNLLKNMLAIGITKTDETIYTNKPPGLIIEAGLPPGLGFDKGSSPKTTHHTQQISNPSKLGAAQVTSSIRLQSELHSKTGNNRAERRPDLSQRGIFERERQTIEIDRLKSKAGPTQKSNQVISYHEECDSLMEDLMASSKQNQHEVDSKISPILEKKSASKPPLAPSLPKSTNRAVDDMLSGMDLATLFPSPALSRQYSPASSLPGSSVDLPSMGTVLSPKEDMWNDVSQSLQTEPSFQSTISWSGHDNENSSVPFSRSSPLVPSSDNYDEADDDFLLSGAVDMLRLEDEELDGVYYGANKLPLSTLPSSAYSTGLGSRLVDDSNAAQIGSSAPNTTVRVDVNAIFSVPFVTETMPLTPVPTIATASKMSGSSQFTFHSPTSSATSPVSLEANATRSSPAPSKNSGAKMSAAARMQLQKFKAKTPTSAPTSTSDATNQSSTSDLK